MQWSSSVLGYGSATEGKGEQQAYNAPASALSGTPSGYKHLERTRQATIKSHLGQSFPVLPPPRQDPIVLPLLNEHDTCVRVRRQRGDLRSSHRARRRTSNPA
ncbi:hypothetical protein CF326_g10003 [Tilletia indica]|nr:hypothetical protein CF326_g10003 [Tilletia indica]